MHITLMCFTLYFQDLLLDTDLHSSKNSTKRRSIAQWPYKVLDAPKLVDDFYLNLVDWGSHEMVAVCLARNVYLWNAYTSKVKSQKCKTTLVYHSQAS